MNEEKKYPSFTATDIEKYHKGQLSAKEMHDLEKAALDDPFLADALEGYAVPGVNATADIEELKNRLAAKLQSGKIIAIGAGSKSNFPWLRAAVVIIGVAGAGLLVYQFAFNNKEENSIAKSEPKITEEIKTSDSNRTASPIMTDTENSVVSNNQKKTTTAGNGRSKQITVSKQNNGRASLVADSISFYFNNSGNRQASSAPVNRGEDISLSNKKKETNDDEVIANRENKVKEKEIKKDTDGDGVMDKPEQQSGAGYINPNRSVTLNNRAQNQRNNYFRGRIIDPNNNPVPFANVTNTQDSVGTYSDARGYFNLISPDSVLNVQIRSIGFDNNNTRLRGDVTSNEVVMQEDRSSLAEVVISNKKPNAAARSRDANIKLEESEPADGWDNYDTYLANNLNIPDEIMIKRGSGDVEVSFEVDKNGDPINIKVEKSLCGKCDKEAIRLIKDGPKWKRKVKKGKTVVIVPF